MKKKFLITVLSFIFYSYYFFTNLFANTLYPNAICESGVCVMGKGVMKFPGGDVYNGEFDHLGYFDGYGEYTWFEGNSYKGHWKFSQYHGEGKYFFPSGKILKGEFDYGRLKRNNIDIDRSNASIIIPVNVNIINRKNNFFFMLDYWDKSLSFEKASQNIIEDFSYANSLWKDAGIYFDIINFNEIYIGDKKMKKLAKDINWINLYHNRLIEKDSKKAKIFFKKLINFSETKNNKALNLYYYRRGQFQPKGLSCGFAYLNNYKRTTNCPDQGYTLAHELGHVLGLHHVKDPNFLMTDVGGGGLQISSSEILKAKNVYKKYFEKRFK